MADAFFEPLGMRHTTIHGKRKLIAGRVAGYELEADALVNIRRDSEQQAPGHFSVMSTIDDLVVWECCLRRGELLAPSQREAFARHRQPVVTAEDYESAYGSGWFFIEYRGRRFAEHTGMTGNYYLRDLDTGLAVILLTNQTQLTGREALARRIAGMFDPSFPDAG